MNIDVNSAERNGFYIKGNVTTNGVQTGTIDQCIDRVLFSGVQSVSLTQPISFTCGTNIALTNVFTAWSSSKTSSVCSFYKNPDGSLNCTAVTPKCYSYPVPIQVVAPLISNFAYAAACPATNLTQAVSFTSTSAGGTKPYSYTWTFGDGATTITTSNTVTHTYTSAASFPVSLTTADATVPVKTDVQQYTVTTSTTPQSVTAANTGPLTCTSTAVTVSAAASAAGSTYGWSGPAGFISSTASFTTAVAGTYSVTATTTGGCSATATTTVLANTTAPLVNLNSLTLTCRSPTGVLSSTVSGGSGPYRYLWNTATTTATLSVTAGGAYSLTVVGANGCSTVASTTVV